MQGILQLTTVYSEKTKTNLKDQCQSHTASSGGNYDIVMGKNVE